MKKIVQRLGIDITANPQIVKTIEKMNLFGKNSITIQEQEILKNLLMSGKTPDASYVDRIITELVTYIDKENQFFDGIPEKLGYREKEKIAQNIDTQLAEERKISLLRTRKINTATIIEADKQVTMDQKEMEQENEGHDNYGE